jgi:GGDEF domain-containing protein
LSLLSLEKYLYAPHDGPEIARKPEAVTGYFGFSSSILETVRSALVGEALADIAKNLDALRESLRPDYDPSALNEFAQRFEELYGQFRDRLKRADQERADDFRKVLGTLSEAVAYLSSGSQTSGSRFQKLEDSLQLATKMEDLGTLRTHLSKVLVNVRQEATQERQQTRGVLEFLGSQIQDSAQAAARFGTGMALRQDAIEEMNAALRDSGTNGTVYATLFVTDALKQLIVLHGSDISDKLLQEFARKEIQPLAPDGKVFRWSPTSVLLVRRSEKSHEQLRDAGNTAKSLFEYRTFMGNRLVTFKVAVRSLLVEMRGGFDDILCNLDNFAS